MIQDMQSECFQYKLFLYGLKETDLPNFFKTGESKKQVTNLLDKFGDE